jgi:hypothetical protein
MNDTVDNLALAERIVADLDRADVDLNVKSHGPLSRVKCSLSNDPLTQFGKWVSGSSPFDT